MTTIVAVRTPKGKIKFAWDSQTTSGNRAKAGSVKVFANGEVVFGVAGLVRTANVLQYAHLPKRSKGDKDTRKWIITKLIPAVIKELKAVDAGYMEDSQINTCSEIILSVGDEIGYISGELAFTQDEAGIYAIGSGSQFALGALAAGASPQDAVAVAGYFDVYTNQDVTSAKVSSLIAGAK